MKWIKCSEKLPEYDVEVLTINKDFTHMTVSVRFKFASDVEYFRPTICTCCNIEDHEPAYWMPLPNQPEEPLPVAAT